MQQFPKLVTISILCSVALWCQGASPAQLRISAAEKQIQAGVKTTQVYNDLASAYCRRVRETGDISYFNKAQEAIDLSSKITPGDYEAQKLYVTVLLGQHQYAHALKLATELNKRV